MMNREVREIMTKNPQVLSPDQNVQDISHFMLDNRIQQMPVVKDGQLLGLITSHDLWKLYEKNTTLKGFKVRDVMNTNILKISPKDKVGTAAELFAARRFKTLPVVNLRNELKGVVTAFDIIKVAFNAEYKEAILFKKEFAH